MIPENTDTPETDIEQVLPQDLGNIVSADFARKLEREGDEARILEAMYQKVVAACLRCDPIPACQRKDDQLEPPWEVIDRIRCERDEARKQRDRLAEALDKYREALCDGPENCSYKTYEAVDEFAEAALQSLNQPKK